MRLVGVGPQPLMTLEFVGLIVAVTPDHAAVALEGKDMSGDPVEEPAVVADDHGHPPKSTIASSSTPSMSTSKSLVGSSSRSRLPPLLSSLARWTRLRSPPERVLTSASPRGQPHGVHGNLDPAVEVPAPCGLDGILHVGLFREQFVDLVGIRPHAAAHHIIKPFFAKAFDSFSIVKIYCGGIAQRYPGGVVALKSRDQSGSLPYDQRDVRESIPRISSTHAGVAQLVRAAVS